jgi:hypothetical protein
MMGGGCDLWVVVPFALLGQSVRCGVVWAVGVGSSSVVSMIWWYALGPLCSIWVVVVGIA